MISLGDFLGQILAELSIARSHADLEAVRIAELYANHSLLKHFPIPRVRVKDVNLEIPFVITKTEPPPTKGSPRGGVSAELLRERFVKLFDDHLAHFSIKLADKDHQELFNVLKETSDRLVKPEYVQADTNQVADKFISATRKFFVRKKIEADPKTIESFFDALRKTAKADFINARTDIPRIVIGATLSEIRESPPEAVVRISMRISEDGLEWTQISSLDGDDGDENVRLIPE